MNSAVPTRNLGPLPIDTLRWPLQVADMEPIRDALPGAWARLKQDVNCGLRRGAWYRVVALTPEDAVLQVPRRERVRVPRRFLQTLFSRPRHWTIAPLPCPRPPGSLALALRGLPRLPRPRADHGIHRRHAVREVQRPVRDRLG